MICSRLNVDGFDVVVIPQLNSQSLEPVIGGNDAVKVTRALVAGDGNRAMTFDGECGGDPEGCSGNDDLYNPGQGNLLIISQDNNLDDFNDNHRGGHIDFDFSDFGPGTVTVTSLEVFDVSHSGTTVTV